MIELSVNVAEVKGYIKELIEAPGKYFSIITLLKNVCKKIFLSHKLFRTQLMTFQCFTTCFALDLFLYSCY